MRGFRAFSTIGAALALAAAAAPAQAQYDNPTTPGAIPNPGSYQGSLALQQQERQQAQQMEQQNAQMQQRLNQTYSAYGPRGGAGGGRGGSPPPNLWNKPPLPPAKNPLLGRWRQGAHRDVATRQFGAEIGSFVNGAMAGGCDSIFGKGVVAFEPDALQWVAPDGHEEILNHVAYRANGADVVVLTRDPGAIPALFFGFSNHDHAVVGLLNCTLERVGAQRAALTAPAAPAARLAPVGPATSAAAALLDVSVGVGGAPMTNARVWMLRDHPAFALARAGIPVAGEAAALDSMVANCGTPQACQRVLLAIGQAALQTIKTDGSGHAQLQPPGAGRYYVVGFSPWRDKAIVWIQSVDYRGGANAVRLDASNGRPVG